MRGVDAADGGKAAVGAPGTAPHWCHSAVGSSSSARWRRLRGWAAVAPRLHRSGRVGAHSRSRRGPAMGRTRASPARRACNTNAPLDVINETAAAGASGLSYDANSDQYTYVWKTDKTWSQSCRRFLLKFRDGSVQSADFSFHK